MKFFNFWRQILWPNPIVLRASMIFSIFDLAFWYITFIWKSSHFGYKYRGPIQFYFLRLPMFSNPDLLYPLTGILFPHRNFHIVFTNTEAQSNYFFASPDFSNFDLPFLNIIFIWKFSNSHYKY